MQDHPALVVRAAMLRSSLQYLHLLLALVALVMVRSMNMGYKFFKETLGSPKFVCAPMVDQSELAFRLMVKRNGVDLAYTQMMHARNFCRDRTYQRECIDWHDYGYKPYGVHSETGPDDSAELVDKNLIVQLAGDDPDILTKAGRLVQDDKNVVAVDLNLGCPRRLPEGQLWRVSLAGHGPCGHAAEAHGQHVDLPVTAKIRRLATDEDTIDLCQRLEKVGVSMRQSMDAQWNNPSYSQDHVTGGVIKQVKEAVGIPVIANGNVSCRQDALDCLQFTGADSVMSSEGLLENPKLFSMKAIKPSTSCDTQLNTVREYLDSVRSYKPPKPLYQVVEPL